MNKKYSIQILSTCLTISLLLGPAQTYAETTNDGLPYDIENPRDETKLRRSEIPAEKYCGGYARAGYIRTATDGSPSERAVAIGGEYGCGITLIDNINIQFGLSTSIDPGINSDNDARIHGDFFDADKDSYAMLGTAILNASLGRLEANLGRQIFDTPHMDSDDLRMIPNRFEVYQLHYGVNENADIGFAYVRQMSGWENGVDQSRFVDVGRALGADEGAAYVAWGTYEQDGLSVQIWDYRIEDIENIFYAEAVYSAAINDDISWEIGLQYDQGREIGSEKLGNIDADTWGVGAALTYKLITVSAAHNRNYGDSGALASLGGGPFFTSMEDQTLDAVTGPDARSTVLAIEVEALEGLAIGFIASDFRARDKSVYHVRENDFYLSYAFKDSIFLEAIYADINDQNSPDDTDQLRIILTYQFEGPF